MQAEVILGHEAGAAHHFVYLGVFGRDYTDARADGAAVGFCAYALDFEPVVFGAGIIAQERRRLVHVDDGDVDVSVVVEIAEGGASAAVRLSDGGPARRADVDKTSLAEIFVQNLSLFEGDVEPASVDFGEDVAVGHEDIGPAVVVEIEEAYSPAEIFGVDDVEPAIAVVIAYTDAHAALGSAILVEGAADLRADFAEGAILIVAIEAAGTESQAT